MKFNRQILKHPLVIMLSIVIGVLFGYFLRPVAISLAWLGDIYLNFFQMCVIPILITAIVSSLAQLMKNQHAKKYISKMLIVFGCALFFVSVSGAIVGVVGGPGQGLDKNNIVVLSKVIKTSEKSQTLEMNLKDASKDIVVKKPGVLDFLKNIVPSNIFNSLNQGHALEIVFFAIIFGIILGFIKDQSAFMLIEFSKSLLEAFQKLINITMYGLPFGLIFLIGNQIAQVGAEIFFAMIKFIVIFHIGGFILFLVCTAILWFRSGEKNPIKVLSAVLDPIIVSLSTRNSFAALPSSIDSLRDGLHFDGTTVNLVLPLGTTILRFGNIFYFAIAACFVSQIYGIPIDVQAFTLIVIGSVFAGTATAGASGLVTLPMLAIILNPLGLPVEAILIIFMAIDSIIDPMRTFTIVYANMATASLIADRD